MRFKGKTNSGCWFLLVSSTSLFFRVLSTKLMITIYKSVILHTVLVKFGPFSEEKNTNWESEKKSSLGVIILPSMSIQLVLEYLLSSGSMLSNWYTFPGFSSNMLVLSPCIYITHHFLTLLMSSLKMESVCYAKILVPTIINLMKIGYEGMEGIKLA
jgi:hypothetical protein